MINIIIPLIVYPFDVMVILHEGSHSEVKKLLKTKLPESVHKEIKRFKGTNSGRVYTFSTGQTVILIREPINSETFKGLLAHEIFHAVISFMEFILCTLSSDSEESYAYLLQYITDEVNAQLNKL